MNRRLNYQPLTLDSTWVPLLSGADARAAWEAIEAIAENLAEWPADLETQPTLGSGTAGLALFFAYLAEATGNERYAEIGRRHVEEMVTAWESRDPFLSFYSGLTGSAFVLEHLQGRLFDDDAVGEAVPELLELVLQRPSWRGEYDLINGLVGFGVYGLELWPKPEAKRCLELILRHLEARAEVQDGGITWHTPKESVPAHQRVDYPGGYFNLGLAHGMPAIFALLGALHQSGIAKSRVGELLEGAWHWLMQQRMPETRGAWFPHATALGVESVKSRLAWCYGDPGVAVALLNGARAADEVSWQATALEIARSCARRSLDGESGISDAGLCHGSGGLGLVFSRLFQVWGDEELADAAIHWFRHALAIRAPGRGVGGYLSFYGMGPEETRWRPTRGFLEGAAGVGLALLAGVAPIEPAWDRVLMTSLRPLAAVSGEPLAAVSGEPLPAVSSRSLEASQSARSPRSAQSSRVG